MNFTESRTEFAFWSLWSAPLLVATDLVNLTEHKRSILTNEEVLAIHHDSLWIAGERIFNNTDGGQAWFRPLANGDVAVILYNEGTNDNPLAKISVTVNFSSFEGVGWGDEDAVMVRDLWEKKNVGISKGSVTARRLGVHDHQMLRLSRSHAIV